MDQKNYLPISNNKEMNLEECETPDYRIRREGDCYDVKFTNKDEHFRCPVDQIIYDRSVISRSLVEDYRSLCEINKLSTDIQYIYTL